MTRINLGERSEVPRIADATPQVLTRCEEEEFGEPLMSGNETAKREMASELLQQGLSQESVCRILNISPETLL